MINKNGFKMKTLLTIPMLIAASFLGAQEKYRIQYDFYELCEGHHFINSNSLAISITILLIGLL